MSQYISSFLIEPVVRQARRLSRPADESPHLVPRPFSQEHETVTQNEIEDDVTETATDENETFPPLSVSAADLSVDSATGVQEGDHPTALRTCENEARPDEEEIHADLTSTSDSIIETDRPELNVNTQGHSLPATDTSFIQRSGIHHGIESTTSSFSNSAPPLVDATMSPADSIPGDEQDSRGRGGSGSSRSTDGALPADDGMSDMRKRIIAIQRTDSSNEAKAKLVHGLMTEKHNSSQQNLLAPRAQSPGSIHSSERPFTPSSPKSMSSLRQTVSPPTSSSSNADPTQPFHLSPGDLKPTYYQKTKAPPKMGEQDEDSAESEEEPKLLGCEHYKRNIKLQCSACHRWYTCRFCHDAVEDHMLNRRETKNMLCMFCGCAQPASQECMSCGECAAWYYCDVCKLWDDSPEKSIYHCSDCGICRLGEGLGKDFFHCKVCSLSLH